MCLSICMGFTTTLEAIPYKRFSYWSLALAHRLGSCSHKGEASSVVLSVLEAMDEGHRSRCSEVALRDRTQLDNSWPAT